MCVCFILLFYVYIKLVPPRCQHTVLLTPFPLPFLLMGNGINPSVTTRSEIDPVQRAYMVQQMKKQKTEENFARYMQDMQDILRKFEHNLRREVKTKTRWEPVKLKRWVLVDGKRASREIPAKPMCNEECIFDIVSFIENRVNKNTNFSNLSDGDVYRIVTEDLKVLNLQMFEKEQEWGLSPVDSRWILNQVGDLIELALRRAKDGLERETWGGSINFNWNDGMTQNKGSSIPGLGWLFGR